jgi:hypothetical protein
MFLSFLYAVLITLAVVELALVAWTVNFLRRYAFRGGAEYPPDDAADHVHRRAREWRLAGLPSRARAASRQKELFEYPRGANWRR